MSSKEEKVFSRNLFAVFLVALTISTTIPGLYFWNFGGPLSSEQATWADFGSFVGGTATPVVSLFAFLALLITIRVQNKTLQVSQEELALTREELAKTRRSAELQAHHFRTEAAINDVIQSIAQIENTIYNLRKRCIPVFDLRPMKTIAGPLHVFLDKDLNTVKFWSGGSEELVGSGDLLPEEIGKVFEFLFEQIMLLKDIPEAKNRYRVIVQKHLETFFLLTTVAALPFDWKVRLDEESKEWLKLYDNKFKKEERKARSILKSDF